MSTATAVADSVDEIVQQEKRELLRLIREDGKYSLETLNLVWLFVDVLRTMVVKTEDNVVKNSLDNSARRFDTFVENLQSYRTPADEVFLKTKEIISFIELNAEAITKPYEYNYWQDVASDGSELHESLKTVLPNLNQRDIEIINTIVRHVWSSILHGLRRGTPSPTPPGRG